MTELRASHADRDQVVEILRIAAGDGRLTIGELDQRLEAALAARTCRELAELTADLPSACRAIAAGPGDFLRIDGFGGDTQRSGTWVVPRAMEVNVVGGSVKLDFAQAVISQPTLHIRVMVRGGILFLVTRPGIEVDASRVCLTAGTIMVRPAAGRPRPVILRIEMSGENVAGWLVAHGHRHPFFL
jgi:hypothetical protein